MNLHPCYIFWTTRPRYSMWYSLFLWPRQLCWVWFNACTWNSHLLHGKFTDLLKCPRVTLLETHSMYVVMNVDGVFSGHCLFDGRTALLATLLCRSRSDRLKLETKHTFIFDLWNFSRKNHFVKRLDYFFICKDFILHIYGVYLNIL